MESSLRRDAWPARERCGPRRAFTLLEVLLTMALLVIVSSLAGIALQRPLARQRLKSAVDAVRTEWCEARNDAMKSGHTYAFRYVVHGDRYHLAPQDDQSAVAAPSAAQPSPSAAQPSASEDDALDDDPLPPPIDKTLPHGIHFLPAEGNGDMAALSDDSETEGADEGNDWSDPIYFYADGSTSDARLLLAADRHSAMRLLLRGITGSVTVDDVTAMTQ